MAAVLSSALGGMSVAVTRFIIADTDPITLALLRFGLGFILLLPLALALRTRWPRGKDWLGVALLGLLFFALYFVVFNVSLGYTTATRGALALSILPLLTMVVGALLRVEALTARKSIGVFIAISGVAIALVIDLGSTPHGAWRGDLIMIAGATCYAFYNVCSPPFIVRSTPLAFVTTAMGSGGACLLLLTWWNSPFTVVRSLEWQQWMAVGYLGIFGTALTYLLWVFALGRTTPTRVANSITIVPIVAAIGGAILVGEPVGLHLFIGIAAVGIGIGIASTGRQE